MQIRNDTSSEQAIAEIINRIKRYRIDYPMTQKELADKSGVSQRSIVYFESGNGIQFNNLVKILIALDLGKNLDLLIPDSTIRPSYFVAEEGRQRAVAERYRHKSTDWKWGDER